jgi:uncharacterized membrane protein
MGRATCCLVVPIHPSAIVISILGVVAGGVVGVGYAVNISNGSIFISGLDKAMSAIPYVGMVCWMALAIISFFGLAACWKQHAKLVAVYFWLLLAHYIVDFGVLVANILAAQQSAKQTLEACQERIRLSGITGDTSPLCKTDSTSVIIFLTILGICKAISTYTTFVIFKYKRWCARQAEEKAAKEAVKRQQGTYRQQLDNGEPQMWSKFED